MLRSLPDEMLLDPDYVVVRDSNISGKGLFATRACHAGETLLIIYGELIDEREALRRERVEANLYIYWNPGGHYIDAARTPTARYINHSCAPNAVTASRDEASLYLVALRDITAGEELTLDYDYPEIYHICRSHNASCLGDVCPRAEAPKQGDYS